MAKWRDYQHKVAEFFRSLGMHARVEYRVTGARGVHDVDVRVTFEQMGVAIAWLVECKEWKTAVTKEKVMALYAIAQDVGADRAFLLSEKGFQSGAIRAAQKTNVTLTDLVEMQSRSREEAENFKLSLLIKCLFALNERLRLHL